MPPSEIEPPFASGYVGIIGALPWRVGRQVGRTIYDANNELIGLMDTRELAAAVVVAVNERVW